MPISPEQLLAGRNSAAENQLVKVASSCEAYGYELALVKIAEMEESAKEEKEEEEKEENGESPALSEEEKKEASAMGLYSFEGFINKLASAGEAMYGDPTVYIRQLAIENGSYEKVAGAAELFQSGRDAVTRFGKEVGSTLRHPSLFMPTNVPAGSSLGRELAIKGVAGAIPGAAIGAAGGAAYDGDNRLRGALLGGGLGAAGGAGLGMGVGYGKKGINALRERFASKAAPTAKKGKK